MKKKDKLYLSNIAILSVNLFAMTSASAQIIGDGCSDGGLVEEFGFCDERPPSCECIAEFGYGGDFERASSTEVSGASYSSIDIIPAFGFTEEQEVASCVLTVRETGDPDSGIDRVELVPGSVNMALVPIFTGSDFFQQFSLRPIDPELPAIGEINAFDRFGNSCDPAFQLDQFDPFGGLRRTESRNLRLFLNRPPGTNGDDVTGARCIETTTPQNPLPNSIGFTDFPGNSLEIDIEIESNGSGTKSICCEYQSEDGSVSPPACGFIELDEQAPNPPEGLRGRAKPGKVDLLWDLVNAAESYNVYRSLDVNGPYDLISSTTNNIHVDLSVDAGQTYYFVVQSVAGSVASDQSSPFEITIPVESSRRRRR